MDDHTFSVLQQRAHQLREEGYSRREIAEALDVRGSGLLTRLLSGTTAPEWTKRPRAKDDLRAKARELRRQGLTYDRISAELNLSKSSVSLWVRDLPPPRPNQERIDAHMTMMRGARIARLEDARTQRKRAAAASICTVSDRELLLLGAMAYWCEGTKDKPWRRSECVRFTNSDPRLILLFLAWLRLVGVADAAYEYRVYIHETADVDAAEHYWARALGIERSRLSKTVLKRHKVTTNRKNRGDSYHGCLSIKVRASSWLYQNIDGYINGIADSLTTGSV